MRRPVPILAALLAAGGCGAPPDAPEAPEAKGVSVEQAVVTLPALPGRPGAFYFTARTGSGPTRLVSITSPRVERIELHRSVMDGTVSRMEKLSDVGFAPGEPLTFAPGGGHAMLFGIDPALRPGDRLRLNFTFDPAPPVTVEAEVRGPGGVVHGGH